MFYDPDQHLTVEPLTHHWNLRRPRLLILHGTACDWATTEGILRGTYKPEEISAHYAISQQGEVVQYLDNTVRAYHAGVAYWGGIDKDINSLSVGIEIECLSHNEMFNTEESTYTPVQVKKLIPLVQQLMSKFRISPWNVLAHSDIAPDYKYDPGIYFPWQELAKQGVGIWHDLEPVQDDPIVTDAKRLSDFRRNLTFYGYTNNPAVAGEKHQNVIRAFQTHFLPWNINGQATEQSIAALDVLLTKKYGSFDL